MARLIQKSGYIKNGKAMGYMEYVATRDGVEIIQSTEPVTKKQEQFIKRLLKDFPDAKELFEYSDYLQTPNRGTASAFIAAALDTHLHEMESESGYMSYIAQRPRAEKHGGHGLFSEADVTDLKAAKGELETHDGKVWTFIFSLRREDAERLGYNKAAAWRNLLKQESAAIAEAMRMLHRAPAYRVRIQAGTGTAGALRRSRQKLVHASDGQDAGCTQSTMVCRCRTERL